MKILIICLICSIAMSSRYTWNWKCVSDRNAEKNLLKNGDLAVPGLKHQLKFVNIPHWGSAMVYRNPTFVARFFSAEERVIKDKLNVAFLSKSDGSINSLKQSIPNLNPGQAYTVFFEHGGRLNINTARYRYL